jgi:hypothetical protein
LEQNFDCEITSRHLNQFESLVTNIFYWCQPKFCEGKQKKYPVIFQMTHFFQSKKGRAESSSGEIHQALLSQFSLLREFFITKGLVKD